MHSVHILGFSALLCVVYSVLLITVYRIRAFYCLSPLNKCFLSMGDNMLNVQFSGLCSYSRLFCLSVFINMVLNLLLQCFTLSVSECPKNHVLPCH